MASVNKVILIGNLGQAPDVRMTHSSFPLSCTFQRSRPAFPRALWCAIESALPAHRSW